MSKKKTNHYVDNEEFYKAMSEWKKEVVEAEQSGDTRPPVSDYIGKCFMEIATHLSYRPNFMNYEYREEMISDGIENCIMYCHNFDPEKSNNPFSYFTQIIYYAFLRRIQKEKKQMYIKYKLLEELDVEGKFPRWIESNEDVDLSESTNVKADYLRLTDSDISKFTPKKEKDKKPLGGFTLDNFLGDKSEDSTDQ